MIPISTCRNFFSCLGSGRGARKSQKAFSLVEVTLALGVAGFSLLVVLGLMHTGLTTEKATIGQTVASGILSEVFSDLAATPKTSLTTQAYQISFANSDIAVPQTLYFSEGGKPTGTLGAAPTTESQYRVSIAVPASTPPAPTMMRILITWPAMADPNPQQWPVKATGSIEVVTALDRS